MTSPPPLVVAATGLRLLFLALRSSGLRGWRDDNEDDEATDGRPRELNKLLPSVDDAVKADEVMECVEAGRPALGVVFFREEEDEGATAALSLLRPSSESSKSSPYESEVYLSDSSSPSVTCSSGCSGGG